MPQVALAWILANDAVTSVIIGARKLAQLDDNLKAVDVTLTADDMKALDEVSRLAPDTRRGWIRSARTGGPASAGTRRFGPSSERSSSAGCSARSPVKWSTCSRHDVPGATSTAPGAIALAAGSSRRSPIWRDTS